MARRTARTWWQDVRERWRGIVDPAAAESTRDSLGWVIGLLVASLRIGTLAQMAPSFTLAVRSSPHPAAAVATWALACVAIVLLCTVVVRTRRPPGSAMVAADTTIAVVMFLLGGLAVSEAHRVGTWIGFQPSWALSVLMAAAVSPSTRVFAAAMVTLCVVDLWFVLPDSRTASAPTVVGNLLTLIVLPVLVRAAFRYANRIAEVADESRARAAELARREEERRAQAAMHNGAAVMALLARDDLSDQVKAALRDQAREETERMRRYLHGEAAARGADESLAGVVERTVTAFPDLRIDTLTDLGGHVQVTHAEAERVGAALTSVLLNVRVHAQASRVVVHLDELEDEWTLTVHDDGVGFDVDSTTEGVGLREVVRAQLARDGIVVRVDSMVGAGTTVVLSGPVRSTHG